MSSTGRSQDGSELGEHPGEDTYMMMTVDSDDGEDRFAFYGAGEDDWWLEADESDFEDMER